MPFETLSADDPTLLDWDGYQYHSNEYHKLNKGQWTDDTMMAKCLAQSLVEKNGYYPEDAAARYLAWLHSGDLRGMGTATKTALEALDAGRPWQESGVVGAQGNGTAMRSIPLGVFFKGVADTEMLIWAATQDSSITHRSKEAREGSIAIALAAAHLAQGGGKRDLATEVARHLEEGELKRGILKVDFYVNVGGLGVAEALRLIGTKAHVLQTVPAALAAFCMTSTYLEAVVVSIKAGGDTDTTAGLAGGLAGIAYGHNALPTYHRGLLEDVAFFESLDSQLCRRL